MADLDGLSLERLHEVSAKLGRVTHYELLGVEPTTDTLTIRRAWFLLAQEFHPDRFFRRDLGPHKARLEAVFRYLMGVLDTLKPREARRAYDLSLRSAECVSRCPWTTWCLAGHGVETESWCREVWPLDLRPVWCCHPRELPRYWCLPEGRRV